MTFRKQRRNINKHTEVGTRELAASVKRDGWIGAITVAADGESFDGSNRIEVGGAAFDDAIVVESDGTKPVVVKRTDIATTDDPKAVRLGFTANQIAHADFDPDSERLRELIANDPVSKAIAEQDERLRKLLKVAKPESVDAGELVDKAAQLQEKWQVKRGDLWQCGRHKVLCGDSTNAEDVARVMQGEKALVFADAPYGISVVGKNGTIGGGNLAAVQSYAPVKNDETTQTAKDFYNLCIGLGYSDLILWGGNYFTDFLPPRACWIVWDKQQTARFADCELAWTSFDSPVRLYHHLWNGMIRKGDDGKKQHPTQKPVGLHVDILNDFAKQDAIIFDGFLGSGTTLIAAEQTGRIGRGVEIEPKYVAVSLERLSNLGLECERIESA